MTEEPSVPPKLDARELEPDSREQSERLESQAEQLDGLGCIFKSSYLSK